MSPIHETTERGKRAGWRQRGYKDGFHGWQPPRRGETPADVPDEFRAEWWIGYRRGREARQRI